MPRFSIIIPTFNRGSLLLRAIQSVFDQNSDDWELILVDDGSTDKTFELISPFMNKPNFRYFFQANAGVSQARNLGAEKSVGVWLIFLDSDDELSKIALEGFGSGISMNPNKNVFLSGFKKVNSLTGEIELFPASPKAYSVPLSGTFAIQRETFFSVGQYDIKLSYAENTELFMRLSEIGEVPIILQTMSLIYHESFDGGSKNFINMEKGLLRILEKHSDRLDTIDRWNLNQTLGVIQMRNGKYAMARKSLLKAICCSPRKFKTYGRFLISCLPNISKKIYKNNISQV